jgi:hypothetical protein
VRGPASEPSTSSSPLPTSHHPSTVSIKPLWQPLQTPVINLSSSPNFFRVFRWTFHNYWHKQHNYSQPKNIKAWYTLNGINSVLKLKLYDCRGQGLLALLTFYLVSRLSPICPYISLLTTPQFVLAIVLHAP